MPVTHPSNIETVKLDDEQAVDEFDRQVIEAGMKRVRADREKLRAQGLLGADGNLLLPELPADMQPGGSAILAVDANPENVHHRRPARRWEIFCLLFCGVREEKL